MNEDKKQGFRTVNSNISELEKEIRSHKRKIFLKVLLVVVIVFLCIAGILLYFYFKPYKQYKVETETKRTDSTATEYVVYGGSILRYNNDGATYTDSSGNLIWNQAYEMQNPSVDICEGYVAISDQEGNKIYILNMSGLQGEVETNKTIKKVRVANQGTVAVLTKQNSTSYLELYDKAGNSLATGELHANNSGFPLDIALSNDANKLAVSMLDISTGQCATTVAIYNFGSVGQNEIDNIVGSYTYENTVIPELHFVSNDRILAFGDNKVIIYEGKQKPKEKVTLNLNKEVKSIFYNSSYFGLVYSNGDSNDTHKIDLYDMNAKLRVEKNISINYKNISFLANGEIGIYSDTQCLILTKRGRTRFSHTFQNPLYYMFSNGRFQKYTLIFEDKIDQIKLK